jgi:hypothetical protein
MRSLPPQEVGISVTGHPTAWIFGAWKQLGQFTKSDIYIYGLQFQETRVATADTTYQVLFEIGFGMVGREVTKIQIPYSYRNDTAVAYYLPPVGRVFLPEPVLVPQYTTISVRVTGSTGSETCNGVKLRYMGTEAMVPPSVSNDTIENFKSVSAGNGMWVSERAW